MAKYLNILALDTALGGCTASVVAGDRACTKSKVMPRGQAEHLVPFAQEAMRTCGLKYEELDAVLCTIGPGAFTGLRIGMSAARTFAFSCNVPVFGISTMHALALNYSGHDPFAVVVETKRSDFYVQKFTADAEEDSAPAALEYDELVRTLDAETVLIGDGVGRFLSKGGDFKNIDGYELPDMGEICDVFRASGGKHPFFVPDPLPLYLRGADVSQPKKQPRVLAG
ncbi:MAG: tRNA (adenosine(37)-N6)-threonylcarbamoyltransferase complex dimerization subunit type 1 TsaB [Alphaproteobacteria bacterium]|nr:tRNA (adenosine(37)-N6)-threonylcarbamoyltransferase complex dimerization subunit type 1 TsaB [Alphaproteobacteria bacterium]